MGSALGAAELEPQMRVLIDDVLYTPAPPVCEDSSPLGFRMYVPDIDEEITLREYFCELLSTLWREQEGFNGKRPFGNSGWHLDVYKFLVASGAVKGRIDDEGYVEDVDKSAADAMIPGLIAAALGVSK